MSSAEEWGFISRTPTTSLVDTHATPVGTQEREAAEARDVGFIEAWDTAFTSGSNVLYQTTRMWDEISSSGPVDPTWNEGVDHFIKQNGIPTALEWRFKATGNQDEATQLLARLRENEAGRRMLELRGGMTTFVAEVFAGLIDLDAPLMFATGGLTAASRAAYSSSKIARMGQGATLGAASAGAIAAGSVAVNPNDDWSILPAMLLAGTALGTVGGSLGRNTPDPQAQRVNRAMQDVQNEVGENLQGGMPNSRIADGDAIEELDPFGSRVTAEALDEQPAPREPGAFNVDEITGSDSAGAARVPGTRKTAQDIESERIRQVTEHFQREDARLGLESQIDGMRAMRNDWRPNTTTENIQHNARVASHNAAARLVQLISRSPATNDFNRIINTDTAVGRMLAYTLFESPVGLLRNNASGSRYFQDYKARALQFIDPVPDMYQEWAKRQKGQNVIQSSLSTPTYQEFNRLVIQEQQARFYGRAGRTSDPAVKAAADAYDNLYKYVAEIEQGRPGQMSVHGSENLTPKSGWTPQHWSGAGMRSLIESGRKKGEIAQAIFETYRQNYPNLKAEDLQIYARAVVDRFLSKNDGTSVSISAWINADGRAAVEQFLARNANIDRNRASQIIDGLTNSRREKAKAGYFHDRLDVDFDFTASNGIRIMDLLDTDLRGMAERRAHRSAGQAALARKGIRSRADFETIVDAMMAEQDLHVPPVKTPVTDAQTAADRARDWFHGPAHLDRSEVMEMYNYFSGAPLYGGLNPTYATVKKLANLSLLNQLGMAQMAEWGTLMASVGVRDFMRRLPPAIKASMRKHDSPLMQEMRQMGVYLPDDRLHRFDQTYSTEKLSSQDHAWLAKLNHTLNLGTRLQGFTSLFYTMNRAQHHMAVDIATTNLMKHFNGTRVMSDVRLRDAIGDDTALNYRLKHYAENVVQYDGNGDVVSLRLDQWSVDDTEALSRYINANARQQVQRAMIGESNTAFHVDGAMSLFWHLKSFPLLALEKQFARNAMIGDAQAIGSFLYGLGWAATAYSTKQILSGTTENLTYEKIARGAINMSNMTGWLPMWSDPILGMLGAGDYNLSGFNGRGSTSIISVPAVFPALDRLAQIPGAILGNGSPQDIRALQATPIIGNAYGIAAIMNAMREASREQRAIQRRSERQAERRIEQESSNSDPIADAFEGTNIPL